MVFKNSKSISNFISSFKSSQKFSINKITFNKYSTFSLNGKLNASINSYLNVSARYYSEKKQIDYDLEKINEDSEKELQREFTPEFEQELSELSSLEILKLTLPILEEQNYNKSYYYLRHWYDPKRKYKNPQDAMALSVFGSNLNIFGFVDEAKVVLNKAIYLYEDIYTEVGNHESEAFNKFLNNNIGDLTSVYRLLEFTANGSLGNIYFSEGNYDSAAVYLGRATNLNNSDPQIMTMLAISYARTNKTKSAIYVFNQLLEQYPEDDVLINRIASFYENGIQDYDKAEEYYKKSLEVNPHNANNRFTYGAFLKFARKNEDECLKQLNECLIANGRFWPAHTLLAEILCSRGKYAEAVPYLENSINNDRNIEGKHYIMAADAFMKLKDEKKAESIFSQYVQNAKGSQYADPEVFFKYADFLKQVDRPRSAQQVYKAILSFPELPNEITKKAEKLLREIEKK